MKKQFIEITPLWSVQPLSELIAVKLTVVVIHVLLSRPTLFWGLHSNFRKVDHRISKWDIVVIAGKRSTGTNVPQTNCCSLSINKYAILSKLVITIPFYWFLNNIGPCPQYEIIIYHSKYCFHTYERSTIKTRYIDLLTKRLQGSVSSSTNLYIDIHSNGTPMNLIEGAFRWR